MRLQDRPVHRGSAAVHFADLASGSEAVRALSQAALFPTNCRLLDPGEAAGSAGTSDGSAVLVLGFESAHHPVEPWLEVALEECRDRGGRLPVPPRYRSESGSGARGRWWRRRRGGGGLAELLPAGALRVATRW